MASSMSEAFLRFLLLTFFSLLWIRKFKGNGSLGEFDTFAVIGATIADNFDVQMPENTIGHSVLDKFN